MKVQLPVKYLGVSWTKWFIELLTNNKFTKVSATKFTNGDLEVRIFRADKFYEVYRDGVKISSKLDFSFPHLTHRLHD